MKTIKTPIIPIEQKFAKREGVNPEIDKKALCIFAATGFFLEADSFYTHTVGTAACNELYHKFRRTYTKPEALF